MNEGSTSENGENAKKNAGFPTFKAQRNATQKRKGKTMKAKEKKEKQTMKTQIKNMSDHGTVEHGDKTLVLTQDAYPTSGSFPVPGGATYTGDWYEAHAVDAGGTEYRVIWTDVDYETEDESDACDWDDPDYVLEA